MLLRETLKKRAERFRALYQAARKAGKDSRTASATAAHDAAIAFPLPKIFDKRRS